MAVFVHQLQELYDKKNGWHQFRVSYYYKCGPHPICRYELENRAQGDVMNQNWPHVYTSRCGFLFNSASPFTVRFTTSCTAQQRLSVLLLVMQ